MTRSPTAPAAPSATPPRAPLPAASTWPATSAAAGRPRTSTWGSSPAPTAPIPTGVPYQLFSPDLGRGLLLSGRHCRAEEASCPVANPPLAGTDAPAGYQNYYLWHGVGFEALIGSADIANTAVEPADFAVRLAAASADLSHVVLESCAALTPDASEALVAGGCDPTKQNLYEWSSALGLRILNDQPGATLGAQAGAVSTDGSRVYLTDLNDGDLYLREGAELTQVDGAAGGAGVFETASADGTVAYFSKGGHLWRYETGGGSATDLTPAGGVVGVLGASEDGSSVYYLAADGLYGWHEGDGATKVAESADASNYPAATGTARVSADGSKLVFVSSASLTGYDNSNVKTGLPESEVFLYDAGADALQCVSCRASGAQPIGPSSIPGATRNGTQADATAAYKPRVLSSDGTRVFFDSADALNPTDVNRENDAYEWTSGDDCEKAAGCISLLSNGRSAGGAEFIDASADGDDAFFVTDASLVAADPGAFDLYDARVGGGYPVPPAAIPCFGDACVELPSEPVDPALNTLNFGPGNPKVRYFRYGGKQGKKNCKRAKKNGARARCGSKGKDKSKGKKHSEKKGGSR